jgi:hypothetical protein
MGRTMKGLVSCMFWAAIATALALNINGYFWWVGILVGAFLGYLFCEPKEFFLALPRAWHEIIGWRLKKGWWKVLGTGILAFIGAGITIVILFIPAIIWPGPKEWAVINVLVSIPPVIGFIGAIFVLATGVSSLILLISMGEDRFDYDGCMEFVKEVLKYLNPISVFFYFPFLGMFLLVKIIVPKIPHATITAIVLSGRFIKRVYILIHSEYRSLCAVDIAFGGTIGYIAGSMITGMIFGGIFWLINYQMVTRRILRLSFSKN